MDNNFFAGKYVLVMGLGRFGGGVDAAKYVAGRGANVIVTDLAGANELSDSLAQLSAYTDIEYHLGSHSEDDFSKADIVIANPAVSPDNKFLEIARSHNKIITSQIALFFELCPARIIGITGSNGKSTTAALTVHLLRTAQNPGYGKVWLSGNIGNKPLLMLLDEIEPDDLVVLELSSFQIEQLAAERKAPQITLLTNLLPNHLDRYGTFEKYCAAKESLFANQVPVGESLPVSIFNREDEIAARWYDQYDKEPRRKCLTYSADNVSETVSNTFTLPGRCNLSNLAAAMAVAGFFGVNDQRIADSVTDFKALPHRLELIAEHNDIRWFNDSKATTPEATIAALEAFEEPIVLIAGGYDKRLPFQTIGKVIADKTKAAILIGQTANKINQAIENSASQKSMPTIKICDSLNKAVNFAGQTATPGDVVLLSPACASYDMFGNYERRGEEFVRLVRKLTR